MLNSSRKNQLKAHADLLRQHDSSFDVGEHAEGDSDNELWLVSYADLMTLLFGFFVLMYVFASQHTAATTMVQNKIAEQFGAEPKSYIAKQAEEIRTQMRDFTGLKDIEIFEDTEGVTLSFKNKLLFESGQAHLTAMAQQTLQAMISQIHKVIADAPIVIEGHTDDRNLVEKTFRDNWDLSAARAVEVLRVFEGAGFPADHLSAVGMGSSRPLAPNREATGEAILENMERNRRVVIKIHLANHLAASAASSAKP